jgi:hypothetical protein
MGGLKGTMPKPRALSKPHRHRKSACRHAATAALREIGAFAKIND